MADITDMFGKPINQDQIDGMAMAPAFRATPLVGIPNPVVIQMLESYLEAAKRGAIVSFGIAVVQSNGMNSQTYVCAPNTNFTLHSSTVLLEKKVSRFVETGNPDA